MVTVMTHDTLEQQRRPSESQISIISCVCGRESIGVEVARQTIDAASLSFAPRHHAGPGVYRRSGSQPSTTRFENTACDWSGATSSFKLEKRVYQDLCRLRLAHGVAVNLDLVIGKASVSRFEMLVQCEL